MVLFLSESKAPNLYCFSSWAAITIELISAMTIFRGVKTRGGRYSGARAAVFFLWIILIFSQLALHFAVHEEDSSTDQSFRSPPRKARFFDTASFHAPSSSAQLAGNEGDPDTVYAHDKRIVNTGQCSFSNGQENEKRKTGEG
ncbi:hypothetical protein CRYUN_Cryun04dG0171100 [Craigia yunnanensis]